MMTGIYVRARTWLEGFRARASRERGATAVEYAIMLAGIAAVIIAVVAALGQSTNSNFESVKFP